MPTNVKVEKISRKTGLKKKQINGIMVASVAVKLAKGCFAIDFIRRFKQVTRE